MHPTPQDEHRPAGRRVHLRGRVRVGRLRPLFPPTGRNYHLFDTSLMLVGIAAFWYITTEPSVGTRNALDETLLGWLFSPVVWGWLILSAGIVGIVSSYRTRWLDAGYVIVSVTCGLWGVALLIGATVALATTAVPWETAGKAFGTSLWFLYALRNLIAPLYRIEAMHDHPEPTR